MKLRLQRRAFLPKYTIGTLFVDGARFSDTLEDTDRQLETRGCSAKIKDQTAIPRGTYTITLPVSPKFGRKLPRLNNVPCFDGILIHRGNTDVDTSGCILVGENKVVGKVINSTPYEEKLVKLIGAAIVGGETVTITVE